jgi:hypothetical protein
MENKSALHVLKDSCYVAPYKNTPPPVSNPSDRNEQLLGKERDMGTPSEEGKQVYMGLITLL